MYPLAPTLETAQMVAAASGWVPKLMHAAQDFEAVLLETLLDPLVKSFSTVPGADRVAGSDTYQALGTQALASALAHSGGIGLATTIVRNLLHNNKLAGISARPSAKDFDGSADTTRIMGSQEEKRRDAIKDF